MYLVPTDRAPNQAYEAAIESALVDLQLWYGDELGGYTFATVDDGGMAKLHP